MRKIQLYYGVRDDDGQDEWYICQDMVHYACFVKEGPRKYTFDNNSVYSANKTFGSIREAAESCGTITNSLFVQHIDRLWHNYIYMPFWNVYWWIDNLFRKEEEKDER